MTLMTAKHVEVWLRITFGDKVSGAVERTLLRHSDTVVVGGFAGVCWVLVVAFE